MFVFPSSFIILSTDHKKRYSRVADERLSSLATLPTHKHKDVDIDGLLPARTANVIKPSRFCYYVQKGHGVRENLVSVIVSTISYFHVSGAPNENIVQNHLNIALLNVF